MLTIRHIIPVIIFAVVFNITKFISISPLGPTLQKIPQYLKFILFFQAFHPLTTTGVAPLLILVLLNYKVFIQLYCYFLIIQHFHLPDLRSHVGI